MTPAQELATKRTGITVRGGAAEDDQVDHYCSAAAEGFLKLCPANTATYPNKHTAAAS